MGTPTRPSRAGRMGNPRLNVNHHRWRQLADSPRFGENARSVAARRRPAVCARDIAAHTSIRSPRGECGCVRCGTAIPRWPTGRTHSGSGNPSCSTHAAAKRGNCKAAGCYSCGVRGSSNPARCSKDGACHECRLSECGHQDSSHVAPADNRAPTRGTAPAIQIRQTAYCNRCAFL